MERINKSKQRFVTGIVTNFRKNEFSDSTLYSFCIEDEYFCCTLSPKADCHKHLIESFKYVANGRRVKVKWNIPSYIKYNYKQITSITVR